MGVQEGFLQRRLSCLALLFDLCHATHAKQLTHTRRTNRHMALLLSQMTCSVCVKSLRTLTIVSTWVRSAVDVSGIIHVRSLCCMFFLSLSGPIVMRMLCLVGLQR